MKAKLQCHIVRDLLPSYVEGLTEKETSEEIREHLSECEKCEKIYNLMVQGEEIKEAENKELDYLKKLRRKNRNKIILCVFGIIAALTVLIASKLFLIGFKSDGSTLLVTSDLNTAQTYLYVDVFEEYGKNAIKEVKVKNRDSKYEVVVYEVLRTPLYKKSQSSTQISLEGVSEVEIFDKLIWKDGLELDADTGIMLERKIPYMGNASALSKAIDSIDFYLGTYDYTIELQSKEEPFAVTIHYSDELNEQVYPYIEKKAYLLLSLVDNLGEVRWDDSSGYSGALSLEEANSNLPELIKTYNKKINKNYEIKKSVKEYSEDICSLQVLKNAVGL